MSANPQILRDPMLGRPDTALSAGNTTGVLQLGRSMKLVVPSF
jgi:hypothetical protein